MRKTITYFLNTVPSLAELPGPVSKAITEHLPASTIRSMIRIPPQEYPLWQLSGIAIGWRVTPERTLAFSPHKLIMIEVSADGGLQTVVIPSERLLSSEQFTNLLYAYLRLEWAEGGRVETRKIEFNAVGDSIVRRHLDGLRADASRPVETDHPVLDSIAHLPFKFRSYLRMALLPDEPLFAAVYQPAIRQPSRWQRRMLSPQRAVALTPRHLIILEEEIGHFTSTYSMSTRFYPLCRLQEAHWEATDDMARAALRFGGDGPSVEVRFPLEAASAAMLRAGLEAFETTTVR